MLKRYEAAKAMIYTENLVKDAVKDVKWLDSERIYYKKTPKDKNEYEYFEYNILTDEKKAVSKMEDEKGSDYSPDGKYQVISENYNLFLVNNETKEKKQITYDGEEYRAYGVYSGTSQLIKRKMKKMKEFPGLLWRKDGKKFITSVVDERKVKDLYVVQNVPEDKNNPRPVLHSFKYPLPGDEEIPKADLYIYDLEKDSMTKIDYESLPVNYTPPVGDGCMKVSWNTKGDKVYFTALNRFFNEAKMVIADAETGETKVILEEKSDTFLPYDTFGGLDGGINYTFTNYVFSEKPYIIWQSPRDGYSHIYLYNKNTGKEICQITKGTFEVIRLVNVDEEKEEIIFTAREMEGYSDPCGKILCKVGCHGENFEILTEEDANHDTFLSPDGKKFVDIISAVDMPPVAKIKNISDGSEKILEKSDITKLIERGYVMPKRFSYLNENGDRIYGILIMPEGLKEKTPIIDYIYGGVQTNNVPSDFEWSAEPHEMMGSLQSFAQLGMIGVIIDGRGTPKRGKKFYDNCYKNLGGSAGVEDHVYIIKKLAEDYSEIDLDRVGIWGVSGGGYGTVRAMCRYPDFYKAGFAVSGNHNERTYCSSWVERYDGEYDEKMYDEQDNSMIAENLKGKLFIVHGDLDDNVNISASMRVIDELIKHNKDFDMLIVPNTFHDLWSHKYVVRKKWDFFVKNLLGKNPPDNFEL